MKKSEYWVPTLEDSLDCVAKSFTIAARECARARRLTPC